jgi:hypothetical protein
MENVSIDIVSVKKLANGNSQVKIRQNDVSLVDIDIFGKKHKVLRSLGRGRFICREINIQNNMVVEDKPQE